MRSEAGIKIKNIKAGTLYGYNLGVRTRYDYTNAVLSNSLFSHYMEQHGMEIWKGESTRDIICLDFDFGSRSYEEELEHIRKLLAKATDENEISHLNNLLLKVENNKWNYNKLSKDEIRELFYRDGVDVTYFRRDKNGEVIDKEVIHYVMLERNSSKAKLGQVIFIRAELYETAIEWLTMGIHSQLPEHNVKIVELSAYAPLTTSTIVDRWHFPVEDMLILPDQDSTFRAMANIVKPQDYMGTERIVDVAATEAAKQRAIAKNKLDINGNPIYKVCYKKIEVNKKKCVVEHEETDITNTLWDGMGLIETSCLPAYVNGMALLRNHFFKMCGFRTRLQDFFRDWCEKTGNDYETYEIVDMFGFSHRIKDIKIVTTDNAVKWKKFKEFMGGTLPAAYQYWCDRINADGSYFGIVKTDHLSKLGHVQQMSYQMVNSLPCSRADVKEIAQTSITYVETLKTNPDEFEKFLRKNANEINHYEMLADLYDHNHLFAESKWFRQEKKKIINNYVNRLRSGKITVEGDNLTICGNPYALLLHSVGEDWTLDPTFNVEEGAIQCYTKRFEDNSYLAGFRSPHNAPNNIVYLHNHMHPLMDQYFEFSQNIIAVNCIHTDIQARCNGCDFDLTQWVSSTERWF